MFAMNAAFLSNIILTPKFVNQLRKPFKDVNLLKYLKFGCCL